MAERMTTERTPRAGTKKPVAVMIRWVVAQHFDDQAREFETEFHDPVLPLTCFENGNQ
jgi:hypothetical protein